MRARRGNYSVLFTLSFTVFAGFAALAVDVGQLRLSRVRAEAAASAGALGALDALVNGGSDAVAANAAAAFAAVNPLPGSDASYDVVADIGSFDWDDRTFTSGGASNAVQVSVTHPDGTGLLFAPLLLGSGSQLDDAREIGASQIAAARRRDIVLVVDVSRDMGVAGGDVDAVGNAVAGFINTLDNMAIDDEQVAVIVYAGDAVLLSDLADVEANVGALSAMGTGMTPCALTAQDWQNYYRFVTPVAANFLENMWGIGPMDSISAAGSDPTYAWPPVGVEYAWYQAYDIDNIVINDPTEFVANLDWGDQLSEVQQEALWVGSWFIYAFNWPEGQVVSNSPLNCRDGNWWEGRADRVDNSFWYPGVTDPAGVLPVDIGSDGSDQFIDASFAMAGSNPGSGLALARAVLAGGARNPNSDPTVVLIAGAGASCREEVTSFDANTCQDEWEFSGVNEAVNLENMGAKVHVIGVLDDDLDAGDDVYLSGLPSADGTLFLTDDADAVGPRLTQIARDVKLQMVHDET